MTVVAVDQFFGSNDAAWNTSLWTVQADASCTATIQSNAGRLLSTGAAFADVGAGLSGMSAITDVDVLLKWTFTSAAEQYFFVSIRHDGSWATDNSIPYNGYFLTINENADTIILEDSGNGTRTVLDTTAFSMTNNVAYWLRFQATGTTIRYRRWTDGEAEPTSWTVSTTDATHTSGKVALSFSNGAAGSSQSVTVDDLRVTNLVDAPLHALSFDGLYIGAGTDSLGGLVDAYALPAVTGSVDMQSRRYLEPLVMSVSRDSRRFGVVLYRNTAWGISAETWRGRIKQYFDPGKNTAARYMTIYAEDGETIVRMPCYVTSLQMTRGEFRIELTAAQPYWEANNPTTSSTGPSTVTNAGNVAVRPSIAMTQATHKTLRACTVVAATGYGFTAMPIRFALSDANATSTNVYTYVNGVSVPNHVTGSGGASSAVWCLCDAASDGSTTYVDIIYGSSLTNPLCQTLEPGDILGGASTTNSSWIWSAYNLSVNPNYAGQWVTAATGYHNNSSAVYSLTSDGSSAVFAITSTGTSDFDSMVLRVPTGADSSGTSVTGLSRTTANLDGTNAQAFLRTRGPDTDRWTTSWSTRANATVTTAITFTDGAVTFACGLENDGTTVDPSTLTITVSGSTRIDVLSSTDVTVTVGAAANVDYYSGTYVVGGYTLTFTDTFAPDGTLTIDCAAKSITSSASGAIYNAPKFTTSPAIWAALDPGSNTITDGVSAGDTITHRDGFG